MIEVEVKISTGNNKAVEDRLFAMGFIEKSLICEEDVYFKSEFHDFHALDEALRVRTIEDCYSGEVSSCITFKGAKLDKLSMSRPEFETALGEAPIMIHILESIGFKQVPTVKKLRKILKKDDIEACLDSVEGLGDFLELEIMAEEKDKEAALKRLECIMDDLGFTFKDSIRNSYLSMLLKQIDK